MWRRGVAAGSHTPSFSPAPAQPWRHGCGAYVLNMCATRRGKVLEWSSSKQGWLCADVIGLGVSRSNVAPAAPCGSLRRWCRQQPVVLLCVWLKEICAVRATQNSIRCARGSTSKLNNLITDTQPEGVQMLWRRSLAQLMCRCGRGTGHWLLHWCLW